MKYDILIVGAGMTGCVLASRYAENTNKKVLVIDRRNHIGGNCYDYYNQDGVIVQKYGPHALHTNIKKVWDYLSRYTKFNTYHHRVLANIDGIEVPLPFNFNTMRKLFPEQLFKRLEEKLLAKFEYGKKIPILELRKIDDKDLKFLAEYVYEKVFLQYTLKQWDLSPEQIDPSVSGRVPILLSHDDRYFTDTYQGIPMPNYHTMFEKMLYQDGVHVMLNTDFKDIKDTIEYDKLYFTGAIDEYYDEKFGALPYRSCKFDLETYPQERFQDAAQVNYPCNYNYTRITEFKHLYMQKVAATTVAIEYPTPFIDGKNDRYYPIPGEENEVRYKKYLEEAKKDKNVFFKGRLAEYKYYNMDQTVLSALEIEL